MIGILAVFGCGAAYEIAAVSWARFAVAGRAAPTAFWAGVCGAALVFGVTEAPTFWHRAAFAVGYAFGSYVGVKLT